MPEIKRINSYHDSRFSKRVLNQHGCYLMDGIPCEVEIIAEQEAVIRGGLPAYYLDVINVFRFNAPHITCFYREDGREVKFFPPVQLLTLQLHQIQPSQFYVDRDKLAAVSQFIRRAEDIIIQVLPHNERFISLDGHTRLYAAVNNGWQSVRAIVETADDSIFDFVSEAQKRNILTPADLLLVSHAEYEEKWNRFCDAYFQQHPSS